MLDMSAKDPAMQNSLQRARGRGEVCFDAIGLTHLYQSGCAKILLPKTYGPQPEAVIVNSAGGLTGGDIFEFSGTIEAGASLCVTSQTAERVYRARDGVARVENRLTLGAGARMDWLPQETILFDECALARRFEVEIAADAQLLAVESFVLGREAMGETLLRAEVNDQWRVRRGGKLIYADGMRFGPELGGVFEQKVTLDGARAFATILYVAPDAEDRLGEARKLIEGLRVGAAASAWNGILLVRMLAKNAQELRETLMDYLLTFRGTDLPKVWHL